MSEHKRRKRYKGRYPKSFDEKYKELDPDKYPEMREHVIAKGSTPAGSHIPIMVDEIMEILDIQPGEKGVDCTLGYGGHTRVMLEKLSGSGHLYGLDVDSIEIMKTTERLRKLGYDDDLFTPVHTNFMNIEGVAEQYGKLDFVLADLGVSSMQIDDPQRGFSFKHDGPLDLRLDSKAGLPASEYLKGLSRKEIQEILEENDESYASEIATLIDSYQKGGTTISTTSLLYHIIDKAMPDQIDDRKEVVDKSAARVFQAIRIEVNRELETLEAFMAKLPCVLNPGGRVAILTFHSGEDRIVKKAFKKYKNDGLYVEIARHVTRASAAEVHRNPRARSAKLRWAIKSYK